MGHLRPDEMNIQSENEYYAQNIALMYKNKQEYTGILYIMDVDFKTPGY